MLTEWVGRGTQMTEYRVYLLDEQGRIDNAFSIDAPSVQSAINTARLETDAKLEVWSGPKRLAIVPAKEHSATAPAR